jgi:hypothetical protein
MKIISGCYRFLVNQKHKIHFIFCVSLNKSLFNERENQAFSGILYLQSFYK